MGYFKLTYQLKIKVPTSVEIEYLDDKVRFKGPKASISDFAEDIRKISRLKDGQLCKLDKLTLKVSDYITTDQDKVKWIELPGHAWNIMARKFQDVIEGFDSNPFDFNNFGYIIGIPYDIGIEITDLPIDEDNK